MRCPSCGDEFELDVTSCPDCGEPLVQPSAGVGRRAPLGRFHPAMAAAVADLAVRRGLEPQVRPGDDADTVLVDAAARDHLRAQLVVTWSGLVEALDEPARDDVRAIGGDLPGWFDAPAGAWVDRHGHLQVDRSPEEEVAADAGRSVGPALLAAAALLGLFAWYVGDGDLRASAALAALALGALGLFLPR